ncbi:MAG: sulfite exporter TauE/SafE family protein, partial [Bacteroidota bacterium]
SILTLIFNLPENMANGTNRVGIFLQSALAAAGFSKEGKLEIAKIKPFLVPTLLGALGGAWVATQVSNEQFRTVFSYLMVVMLLVILVKPKRWLIQTDHQRKRPIWLTVPLFLALGFYGGFIQMGMGVFFLAVMVLGMRYSLLDSNVVKIVVVGIYTGIILAFFAYKGLVDWRIGAILASGQAVGGWLTAVYASRSEKANTWAHRVLVFVVILAVSKLFGILDWIWTLFN